MDSGDMFIEEEQERVVFEQTLNSFLQYRDYALGQYWEPRFKRWRLLSKRQKSMIPWYESYLRNIHDAIIWNAHFCQTVVKEAVGTWGVRKDMKEWAQPAENDLQKVVLLFAQLVREWSAHCLSERNILLQRLMPFLDTIYGKDRDQIEVLIPGAGLARLVVDMVKQGFKTEGNELSYHMLIMSRYLLNAALTKDHHTIYPFVHTFSNHLDRAAQLRPIKIPDLSLIQDLGGNDLMSMCAGSFVDLYGPNEHIKQSGYYSNSAQMRLTRAQRSRSKDIVVTSFFIDTGMNIIDYIETIQNVLKDNGYWVNFGPLQYHFESAHKLETTCEYDPLTGEFSNCNHEPVSGLELSYQDILMLATNHFEFKLIKDESGIQSTYGKGVSEMSLLGYLCNFTILQKKKRENISIS